MNTKVMNVRAFRSTRIAICALTALHVNVVIPHSEAGIIFHATDVTSSFIGSGADLTGYTAWQIDVSTDNGDLITAVDIAFGGPFHQRIDVGFDGVLGTTPTGVAANGRGDSHLTPGADALFAVNAAEDFNVTSSPLPPGDAGTASFGVGSYLYGAWGIPGDLQSTRTSLAYLVLPDGAIDSLVYDLSIATRSGASSSPVAALAQGDLPELPGRPVAQPNPPGVPPTAPIPTPTPDVAEQPRHDPTVPDEVCDDPTDEPSQPPAFPNVPLVDDPGGVVADGDGHVTTEDPVDRDSVPGNPWGTVDTRELFVRDLTAFSDDLLPAVYFTVLDASQFTVSDAELLAARGFTGAAADSGLLSRNGALSMFSASARISVPEPASGFYLPGIAVWLTGRRRRCGFPRRRLRTCFRHRLLQSPSRSRPSGRRDALWRRRAC